MRLAHDLVIDDLVSVRASDGEGFALDTEQRRADTVEKGEILKATDAIGFEHKH
jgi:hypothetical protein